MTAHRFTVEIPPATLDGALRNTLSGEPADAGAGFFHSTFNQATGELQAYEDFRQLYPAWAAYPPDGCPAYALPAAAVGRLAAKGGRRAKPGAGATRAFAGWDAERVAAERAFAAWCDNFQAVGYAAGAMVRSGVLRFPAPLRPPGLAVSDVAWREIRDALTAAHVRVKGAAGYLLTHPPYLQEVGALQAAWRALRPPARPSFPLRSVRLPAYAFKAATGGAGRAPAAVETFAGRLEAFLAKWGLMSLAAWDLPDPQGPLAPNPLPHGAPAQPLGAVTVTVPTHFRYRTGELAGRVTGLQKARANDEGVDAAYAMLLHPAQYGRMLDYLHLERAVRSRYPADAQPRGIVGAVNAAAAAALEVTPDSVVTLRKYVLASLNGKPPVLRRVRGD